MKKRVRNITAGFLAALFFILLPFDSASAVFEVFADDEFEAGYLIAENAGQGIFNTIINSNYKLDIDQVYMAAESLYPLYFSILYYPNYDTTLDITLNRLEVRDYLLAREEAKRIAAQIIKPGMTTSERAKVISNYVADVCTYDETAAADVNSAPDRAFTAYGAIIKKLAVCAGYSRAFMMICAEANVPCVYVSSPEMNHAFNAVSLYGDIRYVDVTYMDAYAAGSKGRNDYFMRTEDELESDHTWDENMVQTMMDYLYGDAYFDALKLYDLGLFKGTDKGFELDRQLTRSEAAVMLVRLLGAEEDALSANASHPFSDVPSWASPYVGYLYQAGLTNGMSETTYGAALPTRLNDYLTFTLRAAGYVDGEDFEWNQAEAFALESRIADAGLLEAFDEQQISRGDAVQISYSSLSANIKSDFNEQLFQQLIDTGVIEEQITKEVGLW